MEIIFVSLGSKGNATLIKEKDTIVQIDMGVNKKAIVEALSLWNASISDIRALFITHEHTDHVGCLDRYHGDIPVYAGKNVLGNHPLEAQLYEGEAIEVGDLILLPFSSSHDATDPFNFIILGGGMKFGYVTDTGYIRPNGRALLRDCDYYLMESNYETKMLMEGPYPPLLKKRIKGRKGHLSNEHSALYASSFIGPKTKQIFLGHISDENNTPEQAIATYRRIFAEKEVSLQGITLIAIPQKTMQKGGDLL